MNKVDVVEKSNEGKVAVLMGCFLIFLILLGAVAVGFESGNVMSLYEVPRGEAIYMVAQEYISIAMFLALAILLFSGYPVAFILGGLSMLFGLLGYFFEVFQLIEFFNFVPRIWGMACENLVLVAVPAFVYMGVMLERSGIANDLLYCVQVLLRKVPGALALAVTVMGTILAAMTGIIGASVTMMTALALPTMMRQGYSHALSTGVIAASGTLGILIPPSIMLIIMADLMAISVGNVFMAAIVPGLTLSAFYLIYVATLAAVKPSLAPPLPANLLNIPKGEMAPLVIKSFVPPVILLSLINGSILFCFAYFYRSLCGDDVVEHLIIEKAGLGPWGMLILVMVIVFFLGFFLDFLEITLIVLPVFTPLIVQMDFGDHLAHADIKFWFIILLAVNLQTSFLTPPLGFALFYMKGIAPREIKIQSIYKGIIPFVILQALGVITVMVFPEVALWLMHAAYD